VYWQATAVAAGLPPAEACLKLQEKVRDWQQRLGARLGLSIKELTGVHARHLHLQRCHVFCDVPLLAGDSDMADVAALADTDIICSTPEKFGARCSFLQA